MNIKKIIMSVSAGMIVGVFSVLPSLAANTTVVVTPADMATSIGDVLSDPTKWFFYNDETDVIDNTLGSFVVGPVTPPEGSDSVQISVTGTQRRNLATYQFSGTVLEDIVELKFSTYNSSLGNGGSVNRSGYLNFNVDFNGTDTWQNRLVFLPSDNGTVTQDSWQEWDAIQGGAAVWRYSGSVWPGTTDPGLSTTKTWSEILSEYPGIRIRVLDSWLGIRVGEPYSDGYTENIDAFKFGTVNGTITFDFDLSAPIPTPTPINPFDVPEQCNQNIAYNLIEGTNGSNVLNGTNGADLILAKGGSDVVRGNDGDDCIVAGNGSDVVRGGNGKDVILGGAGSDSLYGDADDDTMYGEAGSDSLRGGAGNDMLNGGAGSDVARGEAGTQDTCVAEAKATCEL